MFLRHGQGRLDLRTRYLYQAYSTSDKGLNREDIENLLADNLKPEIMERPRAADPPENVGEATLFAR